MAAATTGDVRIGGLASLPVLPTLAALTVAGVVPTAANFALGAASGTSILAFDTVEPGATLSVTPSDGRVVATSGGLAVGMSANAQSATNYLVTKSAPGYAPTTVVVSVVCYQPIGQSTAFPNAATAEFDLWIKVGQSNNFHGAGIVLAEDRAINAQIASVERYPHGASFSGVANYCAEPLQNGGFTENGVDPTMAGHGYAFARALLTYDPTLLSAAGRPVLLYEHATGGTGVTDPTTQPNWALGNTNSLANGTGLSALIPNLTAILKLYPRAQLRGVTVSLGEEDYQGDWTNTVKPGYLALLNLIRTTFNCPDLPVAWMGLSPAVASFAGRTADLATLPASVPFLAFADTRAGGASGYGLDTITGALGSNDEPSGVTDDPTHFSRYTQVQYVAPRLLKAIRVAETNNTPGSAPATATVPAAITDLSVTASKDSYIQLSWTPHSVTNNGGAAIRGVEAQVSTDGQTTWVAAPARLGSGRVLSSLTNGQAYAIRVRAYNAVGVSGWSNVVTGTPNATDLNAGLVHRLAPNASSSAITDTKNGATIVRSGGTFTADSVNGDYITAPVYWGVTTGAQFPTKSAESVWIRTVGTVGTQVSAPRGYLGRWNGTTQVSNLELQNATVSGNFRYRGGVGTTSPVNSYVAEATALNAWQHYVLLIDDTSGVTKLYRNGVLAQSATGQAARGTALAYYTGLGTNGQANTATGDMCVTRIYDDSVSLFDDNKVMALYQAGRGY